MKLFLIILSQLIISAKVVHANEFNKCISSFIKYPISSSQEEIINYCKCIKPYKVNKIGDLFKDKSDLFLNKDYCIMKNFNNINEVFDAKLNQFFIPYINSELHSIYFKYIKGHNKEKECLVNYYVLICTRQKSLASTYRCLKREFQNLNDYPYKKCFSYKEKWEEV